MLKTWTIPELRGGPSVAVDIRKTSLPPSLKSLNGFLKIKPHPSFGPCLTNVPCSLEASSHSTLQLTLNLSGTGCLFHLVLAQANLPMIFFRIFSSLRLVRSYPLAIGWRTPSWSPHYVVTEHECISSHSWKAVHTVQYHDNGLWDLRHIYWTCYGLLSSPLKLR